MTAIAPRDDLTRSVPFEIERADEDGDGLTLAGYAAVFDKKTRIDSWEGKFDERIAKGAFSKSIRDRKPVLMFEHGRHPLVGSMPLGAFTELKEDARGLHVTARLHDNWLIQPVREAIASGSVDGMSFRFSVVRDEWDPAPPWEMAPGDKRIPLRTLKEVRMAEAGPVVFPAYAQTTVGVRSQQFVNELLADDDTRIALARALIFATPAPSDDTREQQEAPPTDAAQQGTSDGAPLHDETPPQGTSRSTKRERLTAVARLQGLLEDGNESA